MSRSIQYDNVWRRGRSSLAMFFGVTRFRLVHTRGPRCSLFAPASYGAASLPHHHIRTDGITHRRRRRRANVYVHAYNEAQQTLARGTRQGTHTPHARRRGNLRLRGRARMCVMWACAKVCTLRFNWGAREVRIGRGRIQWAKARGGANENQKVRANMIFGFSSMAKSRANSRQSF